MSRLKKRLLLAGAVLAVGGAVGGIAYAQIPSGNTITGCYLKSGGSLRVIDATVTNCKNGETKLEWNQAGPTGATGATGATGPTGAAGISLFATVRDDGTLVRGTATSATRNNEGEYTVTFGQDVSNCAAVANTGGFSGQGTAVFRVDAFTSSSSGSPNEVEVLLFNGLDGTDLDSSFHLIVAC